METGTANHAERNYTAKEGYEFNIFRCIVTGRNTIQSLHKNTKLLLNEDIAQTKITVEGSEDDFDRCVVRREPARIVWQSIVRLASIAQERANDAGIDKSPDLIVGRKWLEYRSDQNAGLIVRRREICDGVDGRRSCMSGGFEFRLE